MNEETQNTNRTDRPARPNRPNRPEGASRARSNPRHRPAGRGAGGRPQGGEGRPQGGPRNQRNGQGQGAGKPGGGAKGGKRRGGGRNNNRRKSMTSPALTHRLNTTDQKSPVLPEVIDEDTVRVIPMSGVEQIGRNMTIVETKDDIIVIDAGFQFVGEGSGAPGIDYILPNTQYLEERKHKIRALVISHGHLDHIGGIPFIMERIGNPPIYTQYLTSLMVKKRQEEFPHMDPIEINIVKEGASFTVGSTTIETFPVTHSIPDVMGVSVITKHGNVVFSADVKLEHVDDDVVPEERKAWEKVGQNNNLVLLCDSTNADREGFSAPEEVVLRNLEKIILTTSGRIIIGTFASQFDRLFAIVAACVKGGKKVVLEGRSMKTNVDIALTADLLKVPPHTFITVGEMDQHPADKIVILSTGAQGEEFAALMRMATDNHKFVKLNERDTIVLSSSVIPGNEIAVQKLKDNIYRRNVKVINYKTANVHSSGHGNAGELNWIRQALKPKFLVPIHGHHYHLKSHMFMAIENGFPRENIAVPDNGTLIDIKNGTEMIVHKQKAPSDIIMVDGFTVGAKQEVVLRDRMSLATDGMFVIIATINSKNGKLRKSPDIISRGFIYLRENQQLLSEARVLVKRTVEKHTQGMNPLDLDYVKDQVTDELNRFLLQKTHKNPMVIPVLIGV